MMTISRSTRSGYLNHITDLLCNSSEMAELPSAAPDRYKYTNICLDCVHNHIIMYTLGQVVYSEIVKESV